MIIVHGSPCGRKIRRIKFKYQVYLLQVADCHGAGFSTVPSTLSPEVQELNLKGNRIRYVGWIGRGGLTYLR